MRIGLKAGEYQEFPSRLYMFKVAMLRRLLHGDAAPVAERSKSGAQIKEWISFGESFG